MLPIQLQLFDKDCSCKNIKSTIMLTNPSFKSLLVICLVLFGFEIASAQEALLLDFNQGRLSHQKTAMIVLGSWAVGNIATGSILQASATGTNKYFHQMNAGWNLVNLGIAAAGYWAVSKSDPSLLGIEESLSEYYKFQKLLLFNAGLDLAYVAGGFYMIERSKRPMITNPERLEGFGRSIILQGAFLFAFDLITYLTSAPYSKAFLPHLQMNALGGIQLGFQYNF